MDSRSQLRSFHITTNHSIIYIAYVSRVNLVMFSVMDGAYVGTY